MQRQSIVEGFNSAIEGIIYVMKTQRNMRLHFLAVISVLILSIYLNFDGTEVALLMGATMLVLLSEIFNTAIEFTVDLLSGEFHPVAKIIKDISAGAVLLAAANALITGYILYKRHLKLPLAASLDKLRETPWHVAAIALILVFAAVVMLKVLFHKGTPLRGGMPSGHAALAFSMWTIVLFFTGNFIIIVFTFIMAFLIARSRLRENVHNLWEILVGSLLGIFGTAMIYQLIKIKWFI